MKVQVQKWDNSLAIRIPKTFALKCGVKQGTLVDVSVVERTIVVAAIADRTYTLEDLLAGVTKRNIHGEIDAGPYRPRDAA